MREEGGALGDEGEGFLFGEALSREDIQLTLDIAVRMKKTNHRTELCVCVCVCVCVCEREREREREREKEREKEREREREHCELIKCLNHSRKSSA